jgi:hypothetical protein
MIQSVRIQGSGIAAQACCALLRRFGWSVNTPEPQVPTVPYLVINEITGAILRDIFGADTQVLRGHEISRRIVVNWWDPIVAEVKEAALVIAAEDLQSLRVPDLTRDSPCETGDWQVYAGEQAPTGKLMNSGRRTAWIFEAHGGNGWESLASVFESQPEGWLFWSPISRRKGFLQMVLPGPMTGAAGICQRMLARTRLLNEHVALKELIAGPVPCSAALNDQLTGARWIGTGTSALRYDPLSGDGTGASLRSAILACAALRAAEENNHPEHYMEYYRHRLIIAFHQHVRACINLYRRAGFNSSWDEEILSLVQNADWETVASLERTRLGFRLFDYNLIPSVSRK